MFKFNIILKCCLKLVAYKFDVWWGTGWGLGLRDSRTQRQIFGNLAGVKIEFNIVVD
ncbi:hypothetical protein [Nostoc sp.]|uniref:hypothetical protein n=1 Tax=Nostoc sp. TaxID=1180 RepID=UPI002FF572E0